MDLCSLSNDELKQLNKKAKCCTAGIRDNIDHFLKKIAEEEEKLKQIQHQRKLILVEKFKRQRAEYNQAKEELKETQQRLEEISKLQVKYYFLLLTN